MAFTSIAAIIAWIVAHPQETIDDALAVEKAVVSAVESAIALWKRFQAGEMTDVQLQAAWTAEGIKVQAANDAWIAAGGH